jgi:hypothetical protein
MLRIHEVLALGLLAGCADVNSVVGGMCAEGYVEQGDTCVPATSVGNDGGLVSNDDGGGTNPDLDGGVPGDRDGSDGSTNPNDSTSTVGPGIVCIAPEIQCGNDCIDPTDDPNNCGSCGHVCPSNSCVAGKCVGSAPGHVVVIGHDYATAPSTFSSQARVLSNATLLPSSNPLRVLSYEQYADSTSVKNAEGVVNGEAKQLGRTINFVATTSAQTVSSTIDVNAYDVLLVHDQKNAPAGTLASIGTTWGSDGHVASFLQAGGVVIVLTGGSGTAQMPALATNAQLLSIASQSSITGSLSVLAPADAIGSGVVSPYIPKPSTVTLDTEQSGGNVVWVVAQNGAPVVVHKIMP